MTKKLQNETHSLLASCESLLIDDLSSIIETARQNVAVTVNASLVLLYWQVGNRISKDVLAHKRAAYGKEIVSTLSRQLTAQFGKGYSRPNLFKMIQFSEVFLEPEIVSTLSRQLSWSHFTQLLSLKDRLRIEFYAEMCRVERWSVRLLNKKIQSLLFERTALSRKPEELAIQEIAKLRDEDLMTPDLVFRDPYFLDFLGLKDTYSEKDLETAILRDLESFLIEMGTDFAFIARQKRITIDTRDYFIDLLFYHRRLRRLVVIELKVGEFQAADKGQLELYLRWLAKHEQRPEELPPLGLILCAGKSDEHVELLELESSGIRIAEYFTELPPPALLRKKLHQAIITARQRLEQKQIEKTGETND